MKKKFLALLVIGIAFITTASAQGFHVGIKAGTNMLKIDDKSFKDEFKFGYNLGGFAEINFTKKIGVQPEVLWSQSSYRTANNIDEVIPGTKADVAVKLNYLQIPLLLNYRPVKFLSLHVGPQFGILINQNNSMLQNGKDAFKKGDFSMLGGAQLNLGPLKAGARYVIGLTDINDISTQSKWKNQGFQLYVGLRII